MITAKHQISKTHIMSDVLEQLRRETLVAGSSVAQQLTLLNEYLHTMYEPDPAAWTETYEIDGLRPMSAMERRTIIMQGQHAHAIMSTWTVYIPAGLLHMSVTKLENNAWISRFLLDLIAIDGILVPIGEEGTTKIATDIVTLAACGRWEAAMKLTFTLWQALHPVMASQHVPEPPLEYLLPDSLMIQAMKADKIVELRVIHELFPFDDARFVVENAYAYGSLAVVQEALAMYMQRDASLPDAVTSRAFYATIIVNIVQNGRIDVFEHFLNVLIQAGGTVQSFLVSIVEATLAHGNMPLFDWLATRYPETIELFEMDWLKTTLLLAQGGNVAFMKRVFDARRPPNAEYATEACKLAMQYNHPLMFEFLLQNSNRQFIAFDALWLNVMRSAHKNAKIVEILRKYSAFTLNPTNINHVNMFKIALASGHIVALNAIQTNEFIQIMNNTRTQFVIYAMQDDSKKSIIWLLEHDAIVHVENYEWFQLNFPKWPLRLLENILQQLKRRSELYNALNASRGELLSGINASRGVMWYVKQNSWYRQARILLEYGAQPALTNEILEKFAVLSLQDGNEQDAMYFLKTKPPVSPNYVAFLLTSAVKGDLLEFTTFILDEYVKDAQFLPVLRNLEREIANNADYSVLLKHALRNAIARFSGRTQVNITF